MNTTFLLLAEFGQADIPLEAIASRYLGLDAKVAKARARRDELPFPCVRPGGSQKSPWLVRVTDLADWLDTEHARARSEWAKRQVG